MVDNFAAFILTHGRPSNVITYDKLRKHGYTGDIYIVIDNEDKTANEYYKRYGKQVLMFNKAAIAETFDEGDNFGDRRAIVYARNACFDLAKSIGVRYFIQLDDDYREFKYRCNERLVYSYQQIFNLDGVFSAMLDFLKETPTKSIAMAQGGDFIGGASEAFKNGIQLKRKCMNTFLCDTNKPVNFIGKMNEDVSTYTRNASIGDLFFTIQLVSVDQMETQINSGGMSEVYLNSGTYIKTFYTVMYSPSCTKVSELVSRSSRRLHHRIAWRNAIPVILREDVKKK